MLHVTTSKDSCPGSLRYAIDKANRLNKPIIIEITPKVNEDIVLNAEIRIKSNIRIINKTGRILTISGDNGERLFHILAPSTRTIFESPENKIILTGGNSCRNGGAISVDNPKNTLILSNITIKHNKAVKGGGIFSLGKVILNSSKVKLNEALSQGGGIWVEKDLNLIGSKVNYNLVLLPLVSSAGGGAFVDNGNTILTNSAISHNKVAFSNIGGSAGGICVMTGNLYVQNHSHVDDNESFDSGGIQVGNGNIYLTNGSTASRNKSFDTVQGSGGGGGITITKGNVFLYHGRIIDNQTVGMFSAGIVSLIGDVTVEHSKIMNNVNNGPGGGVALNIGNFSSHVSVISNNTGASLGGGVVTFTPNSYVYMNATKIVNNKLTNAETIGQTIKAFISVITKNLDNTSQQAKESNGSGSQSLLQILPGILENLTLNFQEIQEKIELSSHIAGAGIASLLSAKITIINSDIEGNTFEKVSDENFPFISLGGGIFIHAGSIDIDNSSIKDNIANDGGGIWSKSNMNLTKTTISGNQASNGAGIYNENTVTISDSTIENNIANNLGGGIFNNGDVTILSSMITENKATEGGGIYSTGDLIIFDSEIDENDPNNIVKV
jgi:predicted outer membrane repeat protein